MSEIITIYDGPNPCPRCLGWKKIANSDDGESWKYWAELPPPSNLAVQLGLIYPVECPKCLGTGMDIRETLGRVVRDAWVAWAKEQSAPKPAPKPEWLEPWEALPEDIREVDRRIGMAVLDALHAMAKGSAE